MEPHDPWDELLRDFATSPNYLIKRGAAAARSETDQTGFSPERPVRDPHEPVTFFDLVRFVEDWLEG